MLLSTINLGASGFFLDVTLDEIEENFISTFHGQFRKKGSDTVYPKLYWQIVNVPVGIERIGNIAFAFDIDGSTEPFTSLYDISEGVYREQVAKAMKVMPNDINHNLLVLNGLNSDNSKPIDDKIIALAINQIESIPELDSCITGYFTDIDDQDSQNFISCLMKADFQQLNYDGFVSREAIMVFRPNISN